MLRYGTMLFEGLSRAGHTVVFAAPREVLNRRRRTSAGPSAGIWKWVGYLDKYGAGVAELASAVRAADIVHVCDHANAVYVPQRPRRQYVVTCHDLLAVRGALGEDTDCPASYAGRWRQRSILLRLQRPTAIACVSGETLRDARRLLAGYRGRLTTVPNALHYPYRPLPPSVTADRLRQSFGALADEPYVL